jgi:hypothetical protein
MIAGIEPLGGRAINRHVAAAPELCTEGSGG